MAHHENTGLRDLWASRYQHCTGRHNYTIDGDEIGFQYGSVEGEFMGFDGKKRAKFAIDYKRVNLETVNTRLISDKEFTIEAQAFHWDCELKIPRPFFVVLTYLSEEFEYKMYYVIPANNAAKLMFQNYNKHPKGQWMTVLQFARWQHLLRDLTLDPEEIIDKEHTRAVGLPDGTKLKDLPNKEHIYPLPQLDFNPNLIEYANQE